MTNKELQSYIITGWSGIPVAVNHNEVRAFPMSGLPIDILIDNDVFVDSISLQIIVIDEVGSPIPFEPLAIQSKISVHGVDNMLTSQPIYSNVFAGSGKDSMLYIDICRKFSANSRITINPSETYLVVRNLATISQLVIVEFYFHIYAKKF